MELIFYLFVFYVNRQAFPAGTNTVYWDGLDENGLWLVRL